MRIGTKMITVAASQTQTAPIPAAWSAVFGILKGRGLINPLILSAASEKRVGEANHGGGGSSIVKGRFLSLSSLNGGLLLPQIFLAEMLEGG